VEVLGHQAVSEDIQREPGAGVDDGVIVSWLVEDGLAAVAAVENVVPHAAHGRFGRFFGIVLQSQEFMGMITLDLGLYGATVVLFLIISVVHYWLGNTRKEQI